MTSLDVRIVFLTKLPNLQIMYFQCITHVFMRYVFRRFHPVRSNVICIHPIRSFEEEEEEDPQKNTQKTNKNDNQTLCINVGFASFKNNKN